MRIGVDLDDVLLQFTPSLIKFHNYKYHTDLKINQFNSYNFWEVWGGTREEAIQKVYEFHKTKYFIDMPPVTKSQESIKQLSKENTLIIITSRQNEIEQETITQIERHFKGYFRNIYLTNQYSKIGESKTKKEICDYLDINLMIEDSLNYSIECVNPKRTIILMNKPWNKSATLPEGIYRVNSWSEVMYKISELKK